MTTITFTNGDTCVLEPGESVKYLPGWLVVQRYVYDRNFGDEGFASYEDVASFPAERVLQVQK